MSYCEPDIVTVLEAASGEDGDEVEVYDLMRAAAEIRRLRAKLEGRWVPVNKLLPSVNECVIGYFPECEENDTESHVVTAGGDVCECVFRQCGKFEVAVSGAYLVATHWMPLPDDPQEATP